MFSSLHRVYKLNLFINKLVPVFLVRAQNLSHGIVIKPSIENRVSQMGYQWDINIFLKKYLYMVSFLFSLYFLFFLMHTNLSKKKLCSFIQRYSFFPAQSSVVADEFVFLILPTYCIILPTYCSQTRKNLI